MTQLALVEFNWQQTTDQTNQIYYDIGNENVRNDNTNKENVNNDDIQDDKEMKKKMMISTMKTTT